MAFWKKSDDPWDRKPGKQKKAETAWYCRACEKIVFHAPQSSSGPNYVWENGRVKQPGPEEADIPGDEDWSANPKAYGACREQMEHRKTKENE